jgi:hypothetical protein
MAIPVDVKGKYYQAIQDTCISDSAWCRTHWQSILHDYGKARHFQWCADILEPLYECVRDETKLSTVNHLFITAICDALGIRAEISWSRDYELIGDKSEKLLHLCLQAGASSYLSGPSAQCYLDVPLFQSHGIEVEWMDYSGYPEYEQLHPPFEHGVSIIDLMMLKGNEASDFMKWKGVQQ